MDELSPITTDVSSSPRSCWLKLLAPSIYPRVGLRPVVLKPLTDVALELRPVEGRRAFEDAGDFLS